MKIAAIIENKISDGGGFAMSVDLILSLKKASQNHRRNYSFQLP